MLSVLNVNLTCIPTNTKLYCRTTININNVEWFEGQWKVDTRWEHYQKLGLFWQRILRLRKLDSISTMSFGDLIKFKSEIINGFSSFFQLHWDGYSRNIGAYLELLNIPEKWAHQASAAYSFEVCLLKHTRVCLAALRVPNVMNLSAVHRLKEIGHVFKLTEISVEIPNLSTRWRHFCIERWSMSNIFRKMQIFKQSFCGSINITKNFLFGYIIQIWFQHTRWRQSAAYGMRRRYYSTKWLSLWWFQWKMSKIHM